MPRALPEPSAAPAPPAAVAARAAAAPAARDDRKKAAQTRSQIANRTRPLRVEVQAIDGRMATLAAERSALEALLAAGKRPSAEIAETGRRLNHIAAEVAMLEERWLQLQTEIDAITTAA